ncbi:MAG: hypothetical protein MEQ07_12280 [Aquimonas sp.]|nr:hypothetical protein [Aquimonas sp.]
MFSSMQPECIVDVVGASEAETARLRLLFRMGAGRFASRWRFSDSEPPDLVFVDPADSLGEAAREAAAQAGRTCICLVEPGTEDGPDWALRRPLKLDAIVRMVNTLCAPAPVPAPEQAGRIVSQGENFFDVDLGDTAAAADALPEVRMPEIVRGHGAHDVEALFRRDPMANTTDMLVPHRLADDTSVEFTEGPTARTSARIDNTAERMGNHEQREAPNIDPRLRRSAVEDTRVFPLLDYLGKGLLGAAARIELGGLPALVLDPVNQCYHAEGDLSALELYCLQDLPFTGFKPLTSSELGQVRSALPAKPWIRLRWLVRYLTSEGKLSSQLDPGGKFRIERPLELARDYPTAYRVSTAMLRDLQPLHEIAKQANTGMTEVINVVNAYEACSLLQAQLRERFL